MKISDILGKRQKAESGEQELKRRLKDTRSEIAAKRQSITSALLDGRPIDGLLSEIAALQSQESGLLDALASLAQANQVLNTQAEQAQAEQAERDFAELERRISQACIKHLQDAYTLRDELAALRVDYAKAESLSKRFPALPGWKASQAWRFLSALEISLRQVTRSTEIGNPALLEQAGLQRRF